MTFGFGNHYSTTKLFSFLFTIKNYFLEIKNRIFCINLTISFSFLFCYSYKEILLFFILIKPTINNNFFNKEICIFYFICTNLTEIFLVYLKLVYFIISQILIFYILYHFFYFFSFAFYTKEYFFFF